MPRVPRGATIYVYATSPESAIVGSFTAGDVMKDTPAAIWRQLRKELAIDKADYDRYFSGCSLASALEVVEPQRLRRPASLSELGGVSQSWTFTAPQSSLRLRDEAVRRHLEALRTAF